MNTNPTKPNTIEIFSVIIIHHQERYLLLQRAMTKRFAPGLWTGMGGRVEEGEMADIRASALRELQEESGIELEQLDNFLLRRTLMHNRPNAPLTTLVYFTGRLRSLVQPNCPEGTLHWVTAEESQNVDLIDNMSLILPKLINDITQDPEGTSPVHLGLAHYQPDGSLKQVLWTE